LILPNSTHSANLINKSFMFWFCIFNISKVVAKNVIKKRIFLIID